MTSASRCEGSGGGRGGGGSRCLHHSPDPPLTAQALVWPFRSAPGRAGRVAHSHRDVVREKGEEGADAGETQVRTPGRQRQVLRTDVGEFLPADEASDTLFCVFIEVVFIISTGDERNDEKSVHV